MNCKLKQNMGETEKMLRFYISIVFMVLAISSSNYLFVVIPIILIYTALNKRCFIYGLFGINKNIAINQYYQSLLPINNPYPVCIYDLSGDIVFQNNTAQELFNNISNIKDLNIKEETLVEEDSDDLHTYTFVHKVDEQYFKIKIKYLEENEITVAYFSDITTIINLNEEMENTQAEIIYAMGEIGESRSKETGNHVKRVALYSEILALKYGLSSKEADILKMASPMHDIGKVAIPDAILNKPALHTKDEFEVMKTHAILGFNMLNKSDKPIIKAAAIVAHEHHEKYDGSGYPNAIKGNQIHIYGRITAVADVFDALGSSRVYKKAWPLEKILKLLEEEKGKHFDPKIVDIFLENLDVFLEIRDSHIDV